MRPKQKKLKVDKCDKEGGDVSKKNSAQCNQILSAIVCVVGFSLIVMMVLIDGMAGVAILADEPPKSIVSKSNCELVECDITCTNILPEHNISALIEAEYLSMDTSKCDGTIHVLGLQWLNDENSVLNNHWLDTNMFKVRSLDISSKTISRINGGAFKGIMFSNIDELTFRVDIDVWDENTLQGLNSLKALNIRESSVREIRENALKPVASSLQILQIQSTKHSFNPQNITGSVMMQKLEIVDFRYNSYGIELDHLSFTGLRFCKSMYLQRSNLVHFEKGTFSPMPNLGLLDVGDNQIEHLNRDAFGGLILSFRLGVEGNMWICNCDLQWVKTLRMANRTDGSSICASPCSGCEFMQVDFCPEGGTSTNSPTSTTISPTLVSSTTAESTTTNVTNPVGPSSTEQLTTNNLIDSTINDNIVELVCTVGLLEDDIYYGRKLKSTSVDYQIPKQSMNFEIDDNGTGLVKIKVTSDLAPRDLLIWFNKKVDFTDLMNVSKVIGCATNLSTLIEIKNLEIGETYSFCFLKDQERKISPLNCRAHIVKKPWQLETWLSNQEKPLILSLLGVALFICCMLGALVIYCLIRRNPSLLRGSKRVVMVKHKETDAIVLPSSFCGSNLKNQEKDWMNRSFKPVPSCRKPPLRRSVSETSIASMRSMDASYVSATEPTTAQLLNWRLERLRSKMTHESPLRENNLEPPPLPPPNNRSILSERPHSPSLLSHYESITDA